MSKIAALLVVAIVSACATPPSHINDVCAVFDQRDGWFGNWRTAATSAERKYGIPVPVLMATVRKESGFKGNARPPRTKLFGFIPWTRPSTAYGYSQALNGTWTQYQTETGNWTARRTNFADAIDFVGWYHSKTVQGYSVAPDDAFRLYLAYYLGWSTFQKGQWPSSIQAYARSTDDMAKTYAAQLQSCGG